MATILLVDDEKILRTLLAVALKRHHHRVLEAGGGRRALRLAGHAGGSIDLLVSELALPRMSALELTSKLAASHPSLRALFLSRSPHPQRLEERARSAGYAVLREPFAVADLQARIAQLLEHPAQARKPVARSGETGDPNEARDRHTG